jgi:hypothetical protein
MSLPSGITVPCHEQAVRRARRNEMTLHSCGRSEPNVAWLKPHTGLLVMRHRSLSCPHRKPFHDDPHSRGL